jgi:predicted outer membrane repeat protein
MKFLKQLLLMVLLLPLVSNTYAAIVYVKYNATGANNGTSWANAYKQLQNAINAAGSGDTIFVAAGTYRPTKYPPNINSTNPRDKAFYLNKNIKIYGGFAGTETNLSQRNYATNVTTLSGDFNNDDVVTGVGNILAFNNNSDNAFHVVITNNLSTNARLDGFTIKGGNANSWVGYFIWSSQVYYTNNGGGIYNAGSSPTLTNMIFLDNYAQQGGAVYNTGSSPNFVNTVFSKNGATSGGAIYNSYVSAPSFVNATFSGNHATYLGGALYCVAPMAIQNSILWNNGYNSIYFFDDYSRPTFYHCIVNGSGGSSSWIGSIGLDGGNNLDTDPLFYNYLANDFRLTNSSPALDNGYNGYNSEALDIINSPRVQNSTIDMGAYEGASGVGCQITVASSVTLERLPPRLQVALPLILTFGVTAAHNQTLPI